MIINWILVYYIVWKISFNFGCFFNLFLLFSLLFIFFSSFNPFFFCFIIYIVIKSELSCNDTLCYIFISLGFYKFCYTSILDSKRIEIDEYLQKLNKNEIFYGNGSEFKEISYLCPTKHYNQSITQDKYGSGVKYIRVWIIGREIKNSSLHIYIFMLLYLYIYFRDSEKNAKYFYCYL